MENVSDCFPDIESAPRPCNTKSISWDLALPLNSSTKIKYSLLSNVGSLCINNTLRVNPPFPGNQNGEKK